MRKLSLLSLALIAVTLFGCGRAPSRMLRQGQLPVYDFPLYVSEGVPGNIWKYESNRSRTLLVGGLNDPRGVATDRFNHLYVVERGNNRLLKVDTRSGATTVVSSGLQSPTVVAVDSFGEPFVAQEGTNNVIRGSDQRVFATFASRPTALAFTVDDLMVVGLYDASVVYWGNSAAAPSTTVTNPVNISIDNVGRVYVAEGAASNARVIRYHQRAPNGAGTAVADSLQGPQGIAVDPAGNIYVVEQGAGRIVLAAYDGQLYQWTSGLIDGQYLAFTQY